MWQEYKQAGNEVTSALRQAKRSYFSKMCKEVKKKKKRTPIKIYEIKFEIQQRIRTSALSKEKTAVLH